MKILSFSALAICAASLTALVFTSQAGAATSDINWDVDCSTELCLLYGEIQHRTPTSAEPRFMQIIVGVERATRKAHSMMFQAPPDAAKAKGIVVTFGGKGKSSAAATDRTLLALKIDECNRSGCRAVIKPKPAAERDAADPQAVLDQLNSRSEVSFAYHIGDEKVPLSADLSSFQREYRGLESGKK